MKRVLFALAIFFLICGTAYAGKETGIVKDANRLYNNKEYNAALEMYSEAEEIAPESDVVKFNKGAALYKNGNYGKAVESFSRSLATEDVGLEADSNYNIGNAKYRLGRSIENKDLDRTIKLLGESLDYYNRTIELNGEDEDAKLNYAFVEKVLEELKKKIEEEKKKEKEKQEQDRRGQDQGKDKDEKQQQGGDSEKQEEEQKEQKEEENARESEKRDSLEEEGEASKGDKSEQEKMEAQEEEGSEKEGEDGEKEELDEAPQFQEEEPQEMSEDEARMLLEGHRQQEESKGEIDQKRRTSYKVLKDW
ncbi:MAG: hypothetical protein HQ575_04915 [Candidatus Omnitrophica bacterium]|nr:hypothetical protein [Candidatus Omnitrophota bacterium]